MDFSEVVPNTVWQNFPAKRVAILKKFMELFCIAPLHLIWRKKLWNLIILHHILIYCDRCAAIIRHRIKNQPRKLSTNLFLFNWNRKKQVRIWFLWLKKGSNIAIAFLGKTWTQKISESEAKISRLFLLILSQVLKTA